MHTFTRTALGAALAFSITTSAAFAQDEEARTLATVNGTPITEVEMVMLLRELPPQVQQQGIGPIYPQLVELLIAQKLMADRARAAGLDARPDIAQRLNAMATSYLYGVYLEEIATSEITDAMLQEEYQKTAAAMGGTEINVSHILVETEEEALEVVGLINNGTPFEDLARERSKDPGSGANGGDMGWARKGMFVAPFEEAAFALQPNTFTDVPVQTQFGWHVIWVKETRPVAPPPFEQVEGQLREQLVQARARAIVDAEVAAASVERFDLEGNPMLAPPREPAQ